MNDDSMKIHDVSEEVKFISTDSRITQEEIQRVMSSGKPDFAEGSDAQKFCSESVEGGPLTGMIELTMEKVEELAKAAQETMALFRESIGKQMSMTRAARIRELRVDMEMSWRSVASQTFVDWGTDADWEPPSNQLAGTALCEAAAKLLKQYYMQPPWN